MNRAKLYPNLIAGIVVALFFGISLYLRIVLPYSSVFVGELVKFTGTDAYYHMILVDNLVHTLPDHTTFNPCMIYPGGGGDLFSFFDYLLAGVAWLVSLGAPSQHIIDLVGVYLPPILGALTIIPAYFIGKALLNRWAGVMAAGLMAILPGEFLGRSILGYADHHVAEVLFSTTAMLFLILAIKAGQGKFTFAHVRQKDWAVLIKPLVYSLLAGIFLGIYLLTWQGALLFVFIIFVYFVIQFIIEHLKKQNSDYLCLIGVVTFLIALLIFLPASPGRIYLASLIIALLAPIILIVVSRLMAGRGLKPGYYPLALIGFGAVVLAVFYIVSPSLVRSMLENFKIFAPSGAFLTIMEAQPILFPRGEFSFDVIWGNFTTGFLLSLVSLGIIIYSVVKRAEADKTLIVVWSLIILAATLGQRRFAYYFAVNVAVLTAYVSWLALQFAGFKETMGQVDMPRKIEKKTKKKKRRQQSSSQTSPVSMALGLVAVIVLVFYPNIGPMPQIGAWPAGTKLSIDIASKPSFAPSNAWCEALSWMKDNTPDPFGDPDFYYKIHKEPFTYPQSVYGVAAWWDYGYLIARIGHRLPNSNPSQGHADSMARMLIAQDESMAAKILDGTGFRSKYVVIDYDTVTTKFYALPTWAGDKPETFHEIYYKVEDGQLKYATFFYPEYYRSLVVRLYNFNGQAVIPYEATVISYQERFDQEGRVYKQLVNQEKFDSYEEAKVYVAGQKSGNYKIVGTDPFASLVSLTALKDYKLVYSSKEGVRLPNQKASPQVKIFEYTGR